MLVPKYFQGNKPQTHFTYGLLLLIGFLLIGGVCADYISTWLHFHGSGFWRVSFLFRGILSFALTVILLIHIQKWPNYLVWLLAATALSMLSLGVGYGINPIADMNNYFQSIVMLYKMIYPFFLFIAVRFILIEQPFLRTRLFKIMDIVLLIYLTFIFGGLFTGSEMLATYWDGFRPGFKGILLTQNEATGMLLVSIFWFGLRCFFGQRHIFFFMVSILAALLLGTKGVLLASIPLVAGMFWARKGMLRMVPAFSWVAGSGALLIFLAYRFSNTIQLAVSKFWSYMVQHTHGDSFSALVNILTSGRSERFLSFLPMFADDFSLNFIFGGLPIAYGSMEIDPVDAFLRGGLFFLVLLLVAYWKMFRFSGGTGGKRYKLVLFAIWMGVAFSGGHLWMAGTTAPLLIIALAYAGVMGNPEKYMLCGMLPANLQPNRV